MKLHPMMIAVFSATTFSVPALADDDVLDRYERWEQRLSGRVKALHFYPKGVEKGAMGDVTIGFVIGSDGRPRNISVRRSSGHPVFDAAAVRLVSRLGRLGPIPSANSQVKGVAITLSYGEPTNFAENRRLAKRDADDRLASERRNRLLVSKTARLPDRR